MSFFERAKAAASDLAAKADVAMTQAGINTPGAGGGADRALHDLGVIAYLEATGRSVDPADRERVLATLRELESSGRLGPLTVGPAPGAPGAPPPPPPPPGYVGDAQSAPPPPPPPPPAPPTAPPGSTPPPPPPSWA
ncbi:MAG TPA: hypothetical protein VFN34_04170 [Ornithinibacter sp.]|nr:hypothetical protein [Ornithinibacter sp.]